MSTVKGASWPVSNGYAPEGGPKALPISLDFTAIAAIAIDLVQELQSGAINMIQSVYIDNSNNANAFTLLWDQTGQRIVVPALAGGIWPVITPKDNSRFIASTVAGPVIGIILLNVPMPLTQWGPQTLNVGNVNPVIVPFTDRSGFIAAGGVSQVLMAANGARKYFFVENPSTEAESLFVNFGAAASVNGAATPDSVEIMPGGMWPPAGTNIVTGQAINVNAATIGHKYIAKEG